MERDSESPCTFTTEGGSLKVEGFSLPWSPLSDIEADNREDPNVSKLHLDPPRVMPELLEDDSTECEGAWETSWNGMALPVVKQLHTVYSLKWVLLKDLCTLSNEGDMFFREYGRHFVNSWNHYVTTWFLKSPIYQTSMYSFCLNSTIQYDLDMQVLYAFNYTDKYFWVMYYYSVNYHWKKRMYTSQHHNIWTGLLEKLQLPATPNDVCSICFPPDVLKGWGDCFDNK